jgi:hypothetical protein
VIRVGGRRAILSGAVVFAAVAICWRCAQGQPQPSLPENLEAPAGEQLQVRAHARGQQIYICDGSKWSLNGPDAKLFDDDGHVLGTHFAGPTWQWDDGSQVTGKLIASATPDPESIPWLLLSATSHTGDGAMKNIVSIQRVRTKGGKAPSSGCEGSRKGAKVRVNYTADYYFYLRR